MFIDNYRVPKGTTVLIFIYQIHRDEKYFPQPELFNPDRFLPANCEYLPSYAYIPFSAGRRNCVGQRFAQLEAKIMIANMVRNFLLDCKQELNEIMPDAELVLRTVNPIIFNMKTR